MNAIVGKPWLLSGRRGFGGPGAPPSFNRDFTTGVIGAGAVFTRASAGWYYNSSGVLVQAAVNAPRFDYDPVTLQPKGLLLEDQSANIATDSTTGGANWSLGGVALAAPTKTANNAIAPDGTTTASRVAYPAVSAVGNASTLQQALPGTAAPYTFSIWLRGSVGGETTWLCTTPDGVTYFRQQCVLTTTWQRFSLTTGNLTAAGWFWIVGTDRRDAQQAATPAQTIYAWGAQVEALPYMSSYIPTTSASVTRAQDVLFYPPAALTGFKPPGGTWFAEFIEHDTNYNNDRIIGMGAFDGGDLTPIAMAGGVNIATWDGANAVITTIGGALDAITKAISSFAPGQGKICLNAGPVVTGFQNTGFGLYATLGIKLFNAYTPGYQQNASGHIRAIKYWPRTLSNSEMQAATTLAGPTLTLDFMQPGQLDSRITFTRASSATYVDASGVVQTAAINAPRWDYKAGVLQGLLIEEQRTNVAFPSIPSVAGSWSVFGSTPTPNNGIAPDNTNTLVKLIDDGTNGIHCTVQGYSVVANQPYTWSVYAKAGEIRYLGVRLDNGVSAGLGAVFDLQTGTIALGGASDGGATVSNVTMQPVGNGVYRCVVTGNLGASTLGRVCCINMLTPSYAFPGYQSVAGNGSYIWGAQLEQGAFPTSYIPTTAASVTRAADRMTIPPANMTQWFDTKFSSWLAEFIPGQPGAAGVTPRIVGNPVTAGSLTPLYYGQTAFVGQYDTTGALETIQGMSVGVVAKAVATWAPGNAKVGLNGNLPGNAAGLTNGYGLLATTGVGLFTGGAPAEGMTGYIRRVQYWNRVLSDTEMQTVTA